MEKVQKQKKQIINTVTEEKISAGHETEYFLIQQLLAVKMSICSRGHLGKTCM